jgi:hypothetical protein
LRLRASAALFEAFNSTEARHKFVRVDGPLAAGYDPGVTVRIALAALLLTSAASVARADKTTPLLQDDLSSNKRTKIDGSADDMDLDSIVGGSGGGFSTKQLDAIEDRLRAELRRDRPRATPRLVLFLYPGRVDVQKLRAMSEIFVDMELVMDPCERSVCRDAVGHHIEMVGRAVGKPVIATPNYKITFKNVTLQTSVQMHDTEVQTYVVSIADCIAASQKSGGGMAWLNARQHADEDYEPLMVRAISQKAQSRRVALAGPPSVRRSGGEVDVNLKVHGDRNRAQQQVVDAMWAAASALKSSPATPASSQLEIDLDVPMKGTTSKKFRAPGNQVALFVDGRLDQGTLWSNYVEQVREGKDAGQKMSFSDSDTHGGGGSDDGPAPDDNEALAVLGDNFAAIGGCARAEAARNGKFRGVTLAFTWTPMGHAENVQPKEPALKSGPLQQCLAGAMSSIRLPRFSGAPRTIEYPIRVK